MTEAKSTENQAACCCSSEEADHSCFCESEPSGQMRGNIDDRYRGELKEVVVDFLYLDLSCCDRCQGADKRVEAAIARCRDVLFACGYDIKLNSVLVDDAQKAEFYRFESSPTVRVNGVDICPSVEENDCACCSDMSDEEISCRVFPFNGMYYEVPPTDMLVRGIMEVALQNIQPDELTQPYELPENLEKFYNGVKTKAEKESGSCCCC